MRQQQERYGKVVSFNKITGFGVIKEHRTKRKFDFHRSLRVGVVIEDEMPKLGTKKAEGDINPRDREAVIFTVDTGGVFSWASNAEFRKASIALPVVPIAIVKVGKRKRFKLPRWQFQQMYSRWHSEVKDKTTFRFARRKTKTEFRDFPFAVA